MKVDFGQLVNTITGAPVVDRDKAQMTLRTYCIEIVCQEKQGQTASDKMKACAVALRLLHSEDLKDGDLSFIIAKVKEFSHPAVMATVLPLLGESFE